MRLPKFRNIFTLTAFLQRCLGQGTTVYLPVSYCPLATNGPGTLLDSSFYLVVQRNDPHPGSTLIEYVAGNGTVTASQVEAARYTISNRMLTLAGFGEDTTLPIYLQAPNPIHHLSTSGTSLWEPFQLLASEQNISQSLQLENGVLAWMNSAFDGGGARFCRSETHLNIVFHGPLPDGCVVVRLVAFPQTIQGFGSTSGHSDVPIQPLTVNSRLSTLVPSTISLSSSPTTRRSRFILPSLITLSTGITANLDTPATSAGLLSPAQGTDPMSSQMSAIRTPSNTLGRPTSIFHSISVTRFLVNLPSATATMFASGTISGDQSSTSSIIAVGEVTNSDNSSEPDLDPNDNLACPSIPSDSESSICLGGAYNGATLDINSDGACYTVVCSATLKGGLISDAIDGVESLSDCASRCSLYNLANQQICVGVSFDARLQSCSLYATVSEVDFQPGLEGQQDVALAGAVDLGLDEDNQ